MTQEKTSEVTKAPVKRPKFGTHQCSSAFYKSLDHRVLPENLKIAAKTIREYQKTLGARIHVLAVTGVSGLIFGAPLAYYMRKDLVVVRKADDENTHSFYEVEGVTGEYNYLIVDDLIDTGATVKRIKDKMPARAVCVGVYCYDLGMIHEWESDPEPVMANPVEAGLGLETLITYVVPKSNYLRL